MVATAPQAKSLWKIDAPALLMWQGFILTFPFYLFDSGKPQLSNFFIVGGLIWLISRGKVTLIPAARTVLRFCFAFVFYTFLVNSAHAIAYQDHTFWQASLFYIYNGMVFWFALVLYSTYGRRFVWATYQATIICIAIQAPLGLLLMGQGFSRSTIFFNNPNQLGYFSLLCATIVTVCSWVIPIKTWQLGGLYVAVLYFSVLSLSKAAMGGVGIMMALALITSPKIGISMAAIVGGLISFTTVADTLVANATRRLGGIGTQADDNIGARGYERIYEFSQFVPFGAGESYFTRFTVHGGQEIHSLWGTILFCYGIIGATLCALFIYFSCRGASWRVWPLLPIAFYAITHQGGRFTLLWATLAVFWCTLHYLRTVGPDGSPLQPRHDATPLPA